MLSVRALEREREGDRWGFWVRQHRVLDKFQTGEIFSRKSKGTMSEKQKLSLFSSLGMYSHMSTYTLTHPCTCMDTCIPISMFTCTLTHICTYTQTHTYMHTQSHIHAHTHTHTWMHKRTHALQQNNYLSHCSIAVSRLCDQGNSCKWKLLIRACLHFSEGYSIGIMGKAWWHSCD